MLYFNDLTAVEIEIKLFFVLFRDIFNQVQLKMTIITIIYS